MVGGVGGVGGGWWVCAGVVSVGGRWWEERGRGRDWQFDRGAGGGADVGWCGREGKGAGGGMNGGRGWCGNKLWVGWAVKRGGERAGS